MRHANTNAPDNQLHDITWFQDERLRLLELLAEHDVGWQGSLVDTVRAALEHPRPHPQLSPQQAQEQATPARPLYLAGSADDQGLCRSCDRASACTLGGPTPRICQCTGYRGSPRPRASRQ